jgi:hypothetical protein
LGFQGVHYTRIEGFDLMKSIHKSEGPGKVKANLKEEVKLFEKIYL